MPTVSVIYFSGSGHTTKLAEAVNKGAASVVGVKTNLISISGDDIEKGRYKNDAVFAQLDTSDAIIFGSATYMGGPAAQFKAFADATASKWFTSAWRDKIAAGGSEPLASGGIGERLELRRWPAHVSRAAEDNRIARIQMREDGVIFVTAFFNVVAADGNEVCLHARDGRCAFVDGFGEFRRVAGAGEIDDRYGWHNFR